MLKKLVYIVLIIIFIEPAYSFSKDMLDKAVTWVDEEQILEQLAVMGDRVEIEQVEQLPNSENEIIAPVISEEGQTQVSPTKAVVTNQEDLTDVFYTSFKNWYTQFQVTYKGNTKNIEKIIETAIADALAKDEYVLGHTGKRSIKYEYTKSSAKIRIEQSYLTTPQQEAIVNQTVKEIVSKWQGLSDFEKIKAVNDYVVRNTVYTTSTTASPHSAYAVLLEQKGVCQGYALLSLKMLQELGVETKYVVGYVGAEGHAWNLVKLDGQWYHLDTTWNDPVPDRAGIVRYQYFLVDDTTLAQDHSWIQNDYPAAKSTKYKVMHSVDYAIEQNGNLYYSNLDENNALYQMNLKTFRTSRLTDSRAIFLAGYGDWIYFSNYSRGAYLTKIRTDGSGETTVYKAESENLFIENGYLYFTSNGQQRLKLE